MVAYLLSKHLVNLLINLVYHKLKCLLFCLPFWIFAWSFLLRELTLHSMNRSWIQRGPVIPLYCCHPEHLWEKHFNRVSWICLCSILTDIYFSQKWNILKLTCVCAQLWLTLCDPMDCSLPGSSVHGIFQASVLEWVACPPPGDLPDAGIQHTSAIFNLDWQVDSLPLAPPGKP